MACNEYFIAVSIPLHSVNLFMLSSVLISIFTEFVLYTVSASPHFCVCLTTWLNHSLLLFVSSTSKRDSVSLLLQPPRYMCRKVAVNAWSSKYFHFSFVLVV